MLFVNILSKFTSDFYGDIAVAIFFVVGLCNICLFVCAGTDVACLLVCRPYGAWVLLSAGCDTPTAATISSSNRSVAFPQS